MAVKALFLLGFLIAQVSCGGNSLTFVIDDTDSMADDINQVTIASKSIVDIVLGEKSSQIEDIVLVTFNDPESLTKHRKTTTTKDANELKLAFDSIHVYGGGDCEEMSLSGIKKGLEKSRPGSYLYVFTDAASKDYYKFAEIETLCQKKQIQIVFVLTGYCPDAIEETYKVYRKIAHACNGQVFDISKDEVGEVLEYIKEFIKGDMTVLASKIIPTNELSYINFNIDDQTEYAIVSASGTNVELAVYDKNNKYVTGVHITWTKNAQVLKLANLSPGNYTAGVKGNSEVNIMIFGRTDFTFQHGFSTEARTSLQATDTQPRTGVTTHLMVSVQDKFHSVNIREVELRDMKDVVAKRLPLTPLARDLYTTENFLSPQHTFKIAIVATLKKSGNTVKRVAKTPVTPIQLVTVAPEIDKTVNIVQVKEGGSVLLRCSMHNKGKPTPQITWYTKKHGTTDFTKLRDQYDVRIQVTNASTNDYYKCVAKNVAGSDAHTLQLDVQAAPMFRSRYDALRRKEGEPATIDCKVDKGNPPPAFYWEFKAIDEESYTTRIHVGEVLKIPATQLSQSGHYRCVAINVEGRDAKITTLEVQAKPEVEKMDPYHSVMENSTVNLQCRTTKGFPKPTVNWFYRGLHSRKIETKNTDQISISKVQLSDAGWYMCVASNEVGQHEQTVQLVVNAKPEVEKMDPVHSVMENSTVNLRCRTTKGFPIPTVNWFYKGLHSKKYETKNTDQIGISKVQLSDAGWYMCVARNEVGEHEQTVQLVVNAKPEVEKMDPVHSVMENSTVNLRCRTTKGFPKPTVNWFYKGLHSRKIETKNTDQISISKVQLSDAGWYKCVASNEVGQHEQTVQLVVNAKPEVEKMDPVHSVMENSTVNLRCRTTKGFPKPTVNWFYKGLHSRKIETKNTDQISISKVQLSDAGWYKCVASNEVGQHEQTVQLVVNAKPEVEKMDPVHSVMENSTVNLQCRTTKGFPIPTVNWFYKGLHSEKYETKNTDQISISKVQLSDAGWYMCVASNEVGQHEQTVQLVVNAKPEVEKMDPVQSVMENSAVNLQCRTTKGFPKPTGNWFYKGPHSKKYETKNTDQISISKVQLSDAGWYMCVAKNEVEEHVQTVQLVVNAKPELEKIDPFHSVMENSTVNLHCRTTKGFPIPTVNWFYKGLHSEKYETKNTDQISISKVQLSDAGWYSCVARNEVGQHEQTVQLVVNAEPEVEKMDPVQSVMENSAVNLQCRTTKGFPIPTVNWFYKGLHSEKYETKNTDQISISKVQLSDAGWYICVARNEVGHHEQTVQLVVNAKPEVEKMDPVQSVMENSAVNLQCRTTKGFPKPAVNWFYKGLHSKKYETKNTDQISISKVQLSDAGWYMCVARNEVGEHEQTVQLVVNAKPEVEKMDSVRSVMENSTVNLRCRTTKGFPKPTVNWFYKGLHSKTYETKNTNQISISKVQLSDAGWYMCVARNEVGEHEQTVQLVVNAPPRIVFEPPNTDEYIGVEGDVALRVPCAAVGNPTPSITWKVDEHVIGTDKLKQIYVEGSALFLLHPKHADSSNKTHSYVCQAANEFGQAVHAYTVFIDEYIDLDKPNEKQYSLDGQPFEAICPLPYKDPNSVRWYKGSEVLNKTGPKLNFVGENGTLAYNGNYTCRVSDLTGRPTSFTIEVIFGRPPKTARTLFNDTWDGENADLVPSIDIPAVPYAEYQWFYNGQKIKGTHSESIKITDWGQFTCRVSNPLGSLILTWNIASDKVCGIPKSLLKKNTAPVILDSSLSWPKLSSTEKYVIVPHAEKLQFICPDGDNVKTVPNNGFSKFPTKSVHVTCVHEDSFLVDGVSRNISELDCKQSVIPSVVATGELCLGEQTELMRVGFHVNGFTEVYQSCIDKNKHVPLYTKMNTIPIEDRETSSREAVAAKQSCLDKCCYERIQLVDAEDVSMGPAEKATFMNSHNSVNYCKPYNGTNWDDIQMIGRNEIPLTMWSGAAQYRKVGANWTPRYLWKVLKEIGRPEKVVIIHENVVLPGRRLCNGKCGVKYDWFEPSGDRTYCCRLDDFKKIFEVTINFDETPAI